MNNGPEHHPARELVIHTGIEGMNMVNRMIHIANIRDLLTWLVEKRNVTETMASGLYKMLDSNDQESIALAIGIIRTKFWEPNGTNL